MVAVALALSLLQEDVDKALQGAWIGERFTEGDGKGGARGEKVEFVFKNGVLAGRKGNGSLIGEASYALGEGGKALDATGASGGYRGKVYTGLFKLEGDTLFWCVNGTAGKDRPRPTSFNADAGRAHYLIVLKRKP
jgi:uncharacterized protein (TIGR03067 family)